MGGGGTSTNTVQNSAPWAPQQPAIEQGLNQAGLNLFAQQQSGPYQGNFVAGGNPADTQSENIATGYAGGTGAQLQNQTGAAASALLNPNSATNYTNTAQGIANNGIGPQNSALMNVLQGYGTGATTTAGATPALSGALNTAAVNGANSLNGFTSGLGNAASTAGQSVGSAMSGVDSAAQQYANSPQLQAALASTNAQIGQTLNEQTLPGLNQQAAMGGSLNSSRAGMAEGMANEGAGIAEGNADASLENNALNAGLSTASGLYSGDLAQATTANTEGLTAENSLSNNVSSNQTALNLANTSNQLSAANSGISQGINYGAQQANAQLAGNAQVMGGLTTGAGLASNAGSQAANNAGLAASAGALQTTTDQDALNNQLDQWNMQNQYQTGILNNFMAVAGTPLGVSGSTSGETQSTGPGFAGDVGAVAGAAGLYNNLTNATGTSPIVSGLSNLGLSSIGTSGITTAAGDAGQAAAWGAATGAADPSIAGQLSAGLFSAG